MNDIHKVLTDNRLTVMGPKKQVWLFESTRWKQRLRARFCEPMLRINGRLIWEFKTETPPIQSLRKLSAHWSRLVLLLDYESQREREKGLVKASAGKLEHYSIRY